MQAYLTSIAFSALKPTSRIMKRKNFEMTPYSEKGPGHCMVSIASHCPKIYLKNYEP